VHDEPAAAIRERIGRDGPITFATFMTLALYGPHGYYDAPPVGADGDFVTSPHVHPAFGMFVARAIEPLRDALDAHPYHMTEVGAGDGTLARQILASFADVAYTAVEISTGARAALGAIDGVRVATDIERPVDLLLAHELLDNLPFRVVRNGMEIGIDVDRHGTLVERAMPLDEELRAVVGSSTSEERIVPVGALGLIERIAGTVERGYALLIDYGDEGSAGPVHGYRAQRPVADVLAAPGTTDITAGVDFGWVAHHARAQGLRAFPLAHQTDVLRALGFDAWLSDELAAQHRQLEAGQGLDAVRTWSGRSRATMLVDPSSLGRMRWLLLATDGLPAPTWLNAGQDTTTHRPIDRA
jgi:NADH dehydrogenase [ubiquinone] 1 alpha subcomplex assembly factor 7